MYNVLWEAVCALIRVIETTYDCEQHKLSVTLTEVARECLCVITLETHLNTALLHNTRLKHVTFSPVLFTGPHNL